MHCSHSEKKLLDHCWRCVLQAAGRSQRPQIIYCFQECASKLIEAGFSEKSDLTLEPRLGLVDLEKLGIEKPCDQRKVLKLIKAL